MDFQAQTTSAEILRFVAENDVKFIRLIFCDLFGVQKNISIMPDELEDAFGEGISFDASAILGFRGVADSDLFLKPEPATLTLLPWRPQQGRVARFYCSILHPDGRAFECDSRELLRQAIERCRAAGYECKVGAECEFYLFKTDENGDATTIPFDNGGYFDMSPIDRGENVRREICLALEDMGLHPESSHHEQGPGQNEIDFKFSGALDSADDFMTLKTAVKAIAARNGLFASFMPKPLSGKSGSGLHINVSLHKNGQNLFAEEISPERESFIAGVLLRAREMSLFLNSVPNSYERLGELEAPGFVSWSERNRSQLIRTPAASGLRSRMELRSPDPSCNIYLAYALIISAGLEGVQAGLKLPESSDFDSYSDDSVSSRLTPLPQSLGEAARLAADSEFVRRVLGDGLVDKFVSQKLSEARAYDEAGDKTRINSLYFPML